MSRSCEVCESLSALGAGVAPSGRIRWLVVGERLVGLCGEHARRAHDTAADTPDALRRFFIEPAGRRSLLPRRSPLDRRAFPPRPEGRRRSTGRRRTDESG